MKWHMENVDYRPIYRWINKISDTGIKGTRRLAISLAKAIIPLPKDKIIVQTLYDFQLLIDPKNDQGIERSIFYTGTYEKGTLGLINAFLKGGDVVVDAGANIGIISLHASSLVGPGGKVFSFEANPSTKEILDYNIRINDRTNILSSGYALGSEKGKGRIFANISGNRGAASLLDMEHTNVGHDITIIPLGEVEALEWKKVSLIKIDVEGFELEVMKGCEDKLKSPYAPALIVECSNERANYNYTPHDLYDYIRSLNQYKIFKLKKGKNKNSKFIEIKSLADLPEHDNIFCFLPSHFERFGNGFLRSLTYKTV